MSALPSTLENLARLGIGITGILVSTFLFAEESENVIQAVSTEYSCEQADSLKFDKDKYTKLDGTTRVIVDAQWQQCQIRAEQNNNDEIVLIVNPAPISDNNRLFYGLLRRQQLEEAKKACDQGGQLAGVSLMVVGTATGAPGVSELGAAAFKYSDVSCTSLKNQLMKGNVLAALMPSMIVNNAVINKITKDAVSNIPLLSGADKDNINKLINKATEPPSVEVTKKHVVIKTGPVKVSVPKKCCKF